MCLGWGAENCSLTREFLDGSWTKQGWSWWSHLADKRLLMEMDSFWKCECSCGLAQFCHSHSKLLACSALWLVEAEWFCRVKVLVNRSIGFCSQVLWGRRRNEFSSWQNGHDCLVSKYNSVALLEQQIDGPEGAEVKTWVAVQEAVSSSRSDQGACRQA